MTYSSSSLTACEKYNGAGVFFVSGLMATPGDRSVHFVDASLVAAVVQCPQSERHVRQVDNYV